MNFIKISIKGFVKINKIMANIYILTSLYFCAILNTDPFCAEEI